MSEQSQDESQKTEDPTQHRLLEARKKGQIVFSKEVLTFLLFFTFAIYLVTFLPFTSGMIADHTRDIFSKSHTYELTTTSFTPLMWDIGISVAPVFLIPFAMFLVVVIGGGLMQTGLNVSSTPLAPKMERISPFSGFKRIYSGKAIVEFLKGIIKITIIAVVSYLSIHPFMDNLQTLPDSMMSESLDYTLLLMKRIMIGVCCAMAMIAGFDYLYQRHNHIKSLKMSVQEIKEEFKQQEGDPHIKGKLKQIRMERARRRMMAAVPTADVVITNPTHYAVALKYDSETMRAPVVVAKGADIIAAKIREIATENKVPIVRNPPLARVLYDTLDLDDAVPTEHYRAVAEVIGYVYRLKGKIKK